MAYKTRSVGAANTPEYRVYIGARCPRLHAGTPDRYANPTRGPERKGRLAVPRHSPLRECREDGAELHHREWVKDE